MVKMGRVGAGADLSFLADLNFSADLSFWNMTDDRVDSMLCELPESIVNKVKSILFVKDTFTNRQLNEQSWMDSYSLYKELQKDVVISEQLQQPLLNFEIADSIEQVLPDEPQSFTTEGYQS